MMDELRPSAIVLVLVNLVPLAGLLFFSWSTSEILLLYWSESAVIGLFTIIKMLYVKDAPAMKLIYIPFFVVHFGGFMLGHLLFILVIVSLPEGFHSNTYVNGTYYTQDGVVSGEQISQFVSFPLGWLFNFALLFLSHGYSFYSNFIKEKESEKASVTMLFWAPYPRIVVMHITIIAGVFLNAPGVVLVLLKTGVDLASHLLERKAYKF